VGKQQTGTLAFSYRRFSDPKQRHGRSLERQLRDARRWARANGYALDETLSLQDEGLSGYWGDNLMKGELGKFVALCGTPRVPAGSVLIVEDFDRLSRRILSKAWEGFEAILRTGVEIMVLSIGRHFTQKSLDNLTDRILVQAHQDRAHQESKLKAERLRDVWKARRKRARKGRGVCYTNVPGWCIKRGRRRKPDLDPARTATVREMARLYLEEGLGMDRVARNLAARPDEHPSWLRSGTWDGVSIHQILTSPAVWGAYQPHRYDEQRRAVPVGEVVRNHWPAALSEEEALAVRRRLCARRADKRPPDPVRSSLAGLVKDTETGTPLHLRGAGFVNKQGGYRHYFDRLVAGGRQLVIAYEDLEQFVLEAVQRWAPDALSTPRPAQEDRRALALEQQLRQVEEAQAEAQEAMKVRRRKGTMAALLDTIDALDEQAEAVRTELDVIRGRSTSGAAIALPHAQTLIEQLHKAPQADKPELRRRLNLKLREVLSGVWVYRQNLGFRLAAVYIQVWPRAGRPAYGIWFVGKKRIPADFVPLNLAPPAVDFRQPADYKTGKPGGVPPGPP
jgi:DNA invertase Pin-like site-specific DNA recombinase